MHTYILPLLCVIKINLTAVILLLVSSALYAQDKIAFGLSGIYNFPLQTAGGGFRIQIPVSDKMFLVPQVKYMPGFNTIEEVFGGVNLHYNILSNTVSRGTKKLVVPNRPALYVAAGVQYNKWLNYEPSANSKVKASNVIPEIGLGISAGTNFIRLFVEVKYNILWQESYGEIGVLFFPFNSRIRKNNCP